MIEWIDVDCWYLVEYGYLHNKDIIDDRIDRCGFGNLMDWGYPYGIDNIYVGGDRCGFGHMSGWINLIINHVYGIGGGRDRVGFGYLKEWINPHWIDGIGDRIDIHNKRS